MLVVSLSKHKGNVMKNFLFTLCVALLLTSSSTFVVGGGELLARAGVVEQANSLLSKGKQIGSKALTIMYLAAAACGLTSCSEQVTKAIDAIESEPVTVAKIGFTHTAYLYPQTLRGAELAVKQINAAGGIDGTGIVLVAHDNHGDGSIAYASVADVVNYTGVHALVGSETSYIAEVIDEIAQARNTPMVTTGAGSDGVTAAGDFVFMGGFPDSAQGRALAEFATTELGARTAAVLVQEYYLDAESLANEFMASFEALGGEIVMHFGYPNYLFHAHHFDYYKTIVKEIREQVGKLAELDPDVILVPSIVYDSMTVAIVLREEGIQSTLLGSDKWGSGGLLSRSSGAFEGAFFADHFALDDPNLTPEAKQFIQAYTDEYDVPPDSLAGLSFDAVNVVAQAIKQNGGNLDSEAIRDGIAALKNYQGATSIMSYNQNRLPEKRIIIKKVVGNKVVYYKTME